MNVVFSGKVKGWRSSYLDTRTWQILHVLINTILYVFWTISRREDFIFYPSSIPTSSLNQTSRLGEFILLLTAHVFWISRSQASLEMKIFGQIVFYARVGKEGVDEGGKKISPSNRPDPFLPPGRTLHLTALLNFSPNLRFHSEMITFLDKDIFFYWHLGQVKIRRKKFFLS